MISTMIKVQSVTEVQKRTRECSAWERGNVQVFTAQVAFELDFERQ